MGLLSIIRKIKKKEKEMRILMVGLDNSGKTTLVLKINGEDTSVISPTLGFNIKTIKYQKANAQQPKLFVGMILILIFAEALALYGLIVGLISVSVAGIGY